LQTPADRTFDVALTPRINHRRGRMALRHNLQEREKLRFHATIGYDKTS